MTKSRLSDEELGRIKEQCKVLSKYLKHSGLAEDENEIPHERFLYVQDVEILLKEIDRLRNAPPLDLGGFPWLT